MASNCPSAWESVVRALSLFALLVIGSSVIPAQSAPQPVASNSLTLSNWSQWAGLSKNDAARGLPCRIHGVVVCYDQDWGQLYIHDGQSVMYFSPATFPESPEPGDKVEIEGSTQVTESGPSLTQPVLRIVGRQDLPDAALLRLPDLTNMIGQWIEIGGQIRSVDTSRGRLGLSIHDAGVSCLVYVMGPLPAVDARQFLGREVRVRGINASKVEHGRLAAPSLFAPGTNEVRLSTTHIDFAALPTQSIDDLLGREFGDWTHRPVRLSGVISAYRPAEYVVIQDPTGTIRAEVTQVSRARVGERINLWGYLKVLPGEAVLADAFFESLEMPGQPLATPPIPNVNDGGAFADPPLPLTQISNIFGIPRERLIRRYPVQLQGVVTYADPPYRNGFLQQGNSAVYFDLGQSEVRAGQRVELRGITDPGGFAPQINEATVKVLDDAELPAALRVTLDELATGALDSHFVELEGFVRRAEIDWDHLRLVVGSHRGRFHAVVPGVTNSATARRMVGALVAVPGACSSMMNARGQVSGITLHVPALDQLRILQPAPEDPFVGAATPIAAVATFEAPRTGHGRIKVAGTITIQVPRSGIFIQDASGGMRLITQETDVFRTGDTVEAVGFPALGDFSPCLEEVELRRVSPGQPVEPFKTSANEILTSGRSDGRLVDLQARLIQRVSRSAQPRLVLQDGSFIFTAHLVGQTADDRLHRLESGSLLRLVGVCAIQGGQSREPESFRLLLGDSDAVDVLERPAWWSVRRALGTAGSLALAVLLALAWAGSLRRRVRDQTQVIRRQLDEGKVFAASLDRERHLMATLVDHLPDHVFVMDVAGRIVLTNRSYDEFERRHAIDDLPDGKRLAHPTNPRPTESSPGDEDRSVLIDGSVIIDVERSLTDSKGAPRWFSVSKVPLRDSAESILGLVGIRHDVTERKRTEAELLEVHKQLVAASHRAGMAEVATSVLHNVGNVLTSINVSVKCLTDQARQSRDSQIARLADLLSDAHTDPAQFLRQDPRGRRIPDYLRQLAEHIAAERQNTLRELRSLSRNIDHIKAIVARQQGHARATGVAEQVSVPELIDDAISMCSNSPQGPRIPISRHYPPAGLPTLLLDRHKAIQILVNLVSNALQACDDSLCPEPHIEVATVVDDVQQRLRIMVRDNGSGIAPEHRSMLFRYGFTTRKSGHGFGLHNAALAAHALGGSLHASSDGRDRGAEFTLELPLQGERLTGNAATPVHDPAPASPGLREHREARPKSAREPVPAPIAPSN